MNARRIVPMPAHCSAALLLRWPALCRVPARARPAATTSSAARIAAERRRSRPATPRASANAATRFVVTSCVDDAQARATARSRRPEGAPAAARRGAAARSAPPSGAPSWRPRRPTMRGASERATPRRRRRARGASRRDRDGAAPRRRGERRAAHRLAARPAAAPASARKLGSGRCESTAARQAREARSRATFEAHQREAAEHRKDVLEKKRSSE